MEMLAKLKHYFLQVNKVIFIGITIYFIWNMEEYKLSLNLSAWVKEYYIISLFNSFMDYIGLFFLVIPLTIVILSYFFQEIKLINILASFFALTCNIVGLGMAFSRGLLQESINFKLFTIYHQLSLDTKKDLFLIEFTKYVEKMSLKIPGSTNMERLAFLQENLDKNFNTIYLEKLKLLPPREVKAYVSSIIDSLNKLYDKTHIRKPVPAIYNTIFDYITVANCFKGVLLCVSGFLIYKGYKYLFSNTNESTHVKINVDVAQAGEDLTKIATDSTIEDITLTNNVKSLWGTVDKLNQKLKGMLNRPLEGSHPIEGSQQDLKEIGDIINQNAEVLNKLRSFTQNISNDLGTRKQEINTLMELCNRNVSRTVILENTMGQTAELTNILTLGMQKIGKEQKTLMDISAQTADVIEKFGNTQKEIKIALEDRITAFAETSEKNQNELQENMQILDQNIRNVAIKMKANFEQNEKTLDNFKSELTPIMKDLNATLVKNNQETHHNIAEIKSTQKNIENDVDATSIQLVNIDNKVSLLETQLGTTTCLHESALQNINKRLDQSLITSKELNAEISSIKTKSNSTQLDLQKQIQDLQETVNTIEQTIAKTKDTSISNFTESMTNNTHYNEIQAVTEKIAALHKITVVQEDELNLNKKHQKNLFTTIKKLRKMVEGLQEDNRKLSLRVIGIEQEVQSTSFIAGQNALNETAQALGELNNTSYIEERSKLLNISNIAAKETDKIHYKETHDVD